MSQQNNVLSETGKETRAAETELLVEDVKSPLLNKVRQNYRIFGSISLIFGGTLTMFFYRAGIGLNLFLFSLVMVILLAVSSKKLGIPVKKEAVACYLGTLLLGISGMLTASPTLHFLNICGILLLLELSLVLQFGKESRDFAGMLAKIFSFPFYCIAAIGFPFIDGNRFLKETRAFKNDKFRNILIGSIIALPLLLVSTLLLSSADLVFGKITSRAFTIVFSNEIIPVLMLIVLGFVACYCILCGAADVAVGRTKECAKADPVIAITVIALLLAVYLLFCGIQVAYLFTEGWFELPAEFTYAQYARRGFFELLTVTCFNLLLILICMNVFREHRLLKALMTGITACTYIMIASSAYRMLLYIGEYHLTFLRLFVLLFLFIDTLILAGILISVYRKDFPLFGYCVTVISVCYLLFSFSKPDAYIASYYISHTERAELDLGFLTKELSFDAAAEVLPVLQSSYEGLRESSGEYNPYHEAYLYTKYDIRSYYDDIINRKKGMGIRGFNLSNYLAAESVVKYPINRE